MQSNDFLYAEFDKNREIPILIKVHGDHVYIELRAYYQGQTTASIYNILNREQAKKLTDNLVKWLEGDNGA